MKNFTPKRIVFVAFIFMLTNISFSQTAGTKPNIIVILADDLGYSDVGFNRAPGFNVGLGIIPTPRLDALASNGIVCTNGHVAHPFCGPSRAAIMTGMYPHKIGAQYNLPNDITTDLGVPIDAYANQRVFFPELIDGEGYHTAAYGKWHLGFTEGKYQPMDNGFDEFFGFLGGGKPYTREQYDRTWYRWTVTNSNYNGTPMVYNEPKGGYASPNITNEYQDPLQRGRDYVDRKEFELDDYLTDVLTDEAVDFIDRQTAPGVTDPFFVYLAYNAPHTPLEAPADEIQAFKTANPNFENNVRNDPYITQAQPVTKLPEADRPAKIEELVQDRITYATMVSNMDTNIGKVVDKLVEKGELDNTVIIFLSDNGGKRWEAGAVNLPIQQGKGSVDEGGHKVPFFVHWPDQITPEKTGTYKYQVSSIDLYPTLVSLAGATNDIPADKTIDGVNFMDKLLAGEDARPGQPIFILRPQNGFHNAAIVSYPYRIVRKGGNGQWKLYHVDDVPEQQLTGMVDGRPVSEIIAELEALGADWTRDFLDIKPAWFDHERGNGHPHRILWYGEDNVGNTGPIVFPGYDSTFGDASLGIDDVFNKLFNLYPNPTTDYININFENSVNNLELEVLSITGQSIKKLKATSNNSRLDLSDLQQGTYILRIKADNNLSIEKVVKL